MEEIRSWNGVFYPFPVFGSPNEQVLVANHLPHHKECKELKLPVLAKEHLISLWCLKCRRGRKEREKEEERRKTIIL